MTIDLSGLSAKQLGALIKTAKKQQTIVAKRTPIAKVRTQLARLAKSHGYSIDEVFAGAAPAKRGRKAVGKPGPKPGRKLGKVPPKYRNPANAAETWTGRGKQPRWLADLVAKGKKVEDFLIAGGAAKSAAPAKKTARKAVKRVAKKASKSAAPKA
ncbi:H-NS histone family protein [Xanthomonas campestris pv. phormiicola]|nr:H-NS histone family protein [Xanthomonas campestris pv. phormiicola]UYC17080.1 H-NS histone family protein [Xanthomonas campestris pv. phormiicola]